MNNKQLAQVVALVYHGTCGSHPGWTKAQVLEHEQEVVAEVQLLRKFIIENIVKGVILKPIGPMTKAKFDALPQPLYKCPDCGGMTNGHSSHPIPDAHGEMCHSVIDKRGGWRKLGDYTG